MSVCFHTSILRVTYFFSSKIRGLIFTSSLYRFKTRSIQYLITLSFIVCFCITSFGQNKITGTVTNINNIPLEAATITNKTTGIQNVSLKDGSFSIVAKKGDIITISFIGYVLKQIEIGNDVYLNIQLQESVSNLEDVVMVGYIREKIKEITGSVAVVKSNDLTEVPAGQVEQMLQGKVAGLNVITSGEPGAPANTRLHGIGNFGDVTPLYIIDGVQGNINTINPYDIESLQVLKDAGAYAIYGVRGANGVIVVTTKKGHNSKTSISYNGYIGLQEPLHKELDITLNPKEIGDLHWLAFKNSGQNPADPLYGNGSEPVMPDYVFASPFKGLFKGDPLADENLYNIDSSAGAIYQIAAFNKTGTIGFMKHLNQL
jgi:TonB-dependent SusC/RagA subfamily outer membrane receptor